MYLNNLKKIINYSDFFREHNLTLFPNVQQFYELELAFDEYAHLKPEDRLTRCAYFSQIGQQYTNHYLMNQFSAFDNNYATHSLYPYRGKFHPQFVKALLNSFRMDNNATVLDCFCGSGTTNIECALLGFNSIAIDVNPISTFITKAKYDCLFLDWSSVSNILPLAKISYEIIAKGNTNPELFLKSIHQSPLSELIFLVYLDTLSALKLTSNRNQDIKNLFLKKTSEAQEVLTKYLKGRDVLYQENRAFANHYGSLQVYTTDMLSMPLASNSIDLILTSPPYSYIIDYPGYNESQLDFLQYNISSIRQNTIGLKGKTNNDKLQQYLLDMYTSISEMIRVLKDNKFLILVMGSNTQSTGVDLVEKTIEFGVKQNLILTRNILKPISHPSPSSSSKQTFNEHILVFKKI